MRREMLARDLSRDGKTIEFFGEGNGSARRVVTDLRNSRRSAFLKFPKFTSEHALSFPARKRRAISATSRSKPRLNGKSRWARGVDTKHRDRVGARGVERVKNRS